MLTGDMLRRSARRFPEKPAVLWQGSSLSYRSLEDRSNQLANALLALDLEKAGKVGIICTNRPEYAIAFFGTARTGLVLVNVSVLYSEDELSYVLEKADVEVLLFQDVFAEKGVFVPEQFHADARYYCFQELAKIDITLDETICGDYYASK